MVIESFVLLLNGNSKTTRASTEQKCILLQFKIHTTAYSSLTNSVKCRMFYRLLERPEKNQYLAVFASKFRLKITKHGEKKNSLSQLTSLHFSMAPSLVGCRRPF